MNDADEFYDEFYNLLIKATRPINLDTERSELGRPRHIIVSEQAQTPVIEREPAQSGETDQYAGAHNQVFPHSEVEECSWCNNIIAVGDLALRSECGIHCYHRSCHRVWQYENARPTIGDRRCPVCIYEAHLTKVSEINFEEVKDIPEGEECKEVCPICHDEFGSDGQSVVRTKCHHLFHRNCIKSWAEQGLDVMCPVCRSRLID